MIWLPGRLVKGEMSPNRTLSNPGVSTDAARWSEDESESDEGDTRVAVRSQEEVMSSPVLQHVAFSVRDIDASTDWYTRLFDLTLVAEMDEPAPMKVFMTPSGQAIDLRQDPKVSPDRFTQEVVGLDHVGFVCTSRAELDEWRDRMVTHGVEFSEVAESPFGWHLNFRDPDGIPMEFYLPRSAV
jgi:catechol 2,3-dioxygenase-like lactoylglutathione lyase family enzyme